MLQGQTNAAVRGMLARRQAINRQEGCHRYTRYSGQNESTYIKIKKLKLVFIPLNLIYFTLKIKYLVLIKEWVF